MQRPSRVIALECQRSAILMAVRIRAGSRLCLPETQSAALCTRRDLRAALVADPLWPVDSDVVVAHVAPRSEPSRKWSLRQIIVTSRPLDSATTVQRLVAFYVDEHNLLPKRRSVQNRRMSTDDLNAGPGILV